MSLELPDFRAGGPPPSLEDMLRLVAAAKRTRVTATPPVYRTGNNLKLVREARSIWGKVTGGSSPYSLTEVEDDGTGIGWATKPGGVTCTSCAYEANGQAGLGTKVFRIRRGRRTGEWRFVDDRYAPPCTSTLTVEVFGCGGPMVGAVVTVKDSLGNVVPYDPGVSDTCTIGHQTPGNPCTLPAWCTWTNVTDGATYTVHVDPPADYVSPGSDQTITLVCNNNVVRFQCTDGITGPHFECIDSTHACCNACGAPIPRSLTLDDGFVSVPMSFTGYTTDSSGNFFANWAGSASRTPLVDLYRQGYDPYGNLTCLNIGRPSVDLQFTFTCYSLVGGITGYRMGVTLLYCQTPDGLCYPADSGLPATWSWSWNTCSGTGSSYNTPPGFGCNPVYFPLTIPQPCTCITFNGQIEDLPCDNIGQTSTGGFWPCLFGASNVWNAWYPGDQDWTVTG